MTYNMSDDAIILEQTTSFLGKAVNVLTLPIAILIHGFGNIKGIWEELKCMFNEKKTGKFVSDKIWKSHNKELYSKVEEAVSTDKE